MELMIILMILMNLLLNAGLIINNKAVAGIIYAPAKNRMFYSYEKGCAFEIINNETCKIRLFKNFK